jgi:hypothetical protein
VKPEGKVLSPREAVVSDLDARVEDAKEDGLWYVCIAPINTTALADIFAKVQARGEQVEIVSFHPTDFADVLKIGDRRSGLLSAAMTIDEIAEMRRAGAYPGKLWGADIVVTLEGTQPGIVEVRGSTTVAYLEVHR